MCNSKLHWTLCYFSFWCYWVNLNFCCLLAILIEIINSAIGWKIGAITAGIKKCKPMIKEKEEEIEEENSKTKKEESSIIIKT